MGFAETAELAVRISLKDNVSAGVRGLQSKLGGLAGSVGRVSRGFGQIGSGFVRAGLVVGGAAATGLGAIAKAAIDFEDAFAGVKKTVNQADLAAAGLTFDDLAASFRKMATEIPISAVELAQIGEIAGALGIKAQDIDDFTKTVALLGETTDLTSDQAAEALGKVGTILNLRGQDFQDFADTLVNLGNQGASTESEIIELTKRFAASGKQAGLSTDQILALASAASSLGIEPEAGGSALSRIFNNMATEIALATDKGKAFAKITGDSLQDLKKRINSGDALGILMDTLNGLKGLNRTQAASMLKALGITNVRDRDAILKMAQNLGFVNDQLKIAKTSTGALETEARKRFDTVASKLKLLKNNAIEAAITMGSEFTPAIGRAADKAIAFLKQGDTKDSLRDLGRDIGKFIDGIDWNKVKDGALAMKDALKGAADFALLMLQALEKLPNEFKGVVLGLAALSQIPGGSAIFSGVGNVVGGLAEVLTRSLGSKLPGVGSLFAQPVFVTNWPLGGMGGGIGGAAGAGKWTAAGVAGIALSAVALVDTLRTVQDELIVPRLQEQAGKNIASVEAVIASGDATEIGNALNGIRGSVDSLSGVQRVLYDLNANGVKVHTEGLEAALVGALLKTDPNGTAVRASERADRAKEANLPVIAAVQASEDKMEAARIAIASLTRQESGDTSRMITAIRQSQPNIKVNVSVTANTVTNSITKNYTYSASHVGALSKSGALI